MNKCLCLLLVVVALVSPPTKIKADECNVYFARVVADHIPIYKLVDGEYVGFTPSKTPLYKGAVLRLCDVGGGFIQIVDDPDLRAQHGYSPWRNYDQIEQVFIKSDGLRVVRDLSPINVISETRPEEKLIVVSEEDMSVAWFEGEDLVMFVPTGLGRARDGTSITTVGTGHLCAGYTTVTMGEYAGVPYPLYICMVNQKFTGQAMHGAFWRDWEEINRGYWGSAGCVNLPVTSKYDIYWRGEWLPVDEFNFRWAMTNLRLDPYTEEGFTVSPMSYLGNTNWYQGDDTIRIIIVSGWSDLDLYPDNYGQYHNWQPVIDQLESMYGLVKLPNLDQDGELTFRIKPPGELP